MSVQRTPEHFAGGAASSLDTRQRWTIAGAAGEWCPGTQVARPRRRSRRCWSPSSTRSAPAASSAAAAIAPVVAELDQEHAGGDRPGGRRARGPGARGDRRWWPGSSTRCGGAVSTAAPALAAVAGPSRSGPTGTASAPVGPGAAVDQSGRPLVLTANTATRGGGSVWPPPCADREHSDHRDRWLWITAISFAAPNAVTRPPLDTLPVATGRGP
jgi:hypothetical protein